MDAKVLEEGKALREAYRQLPAPKYWQQDELKLWLWTHKDELIADAGRYAHLRHGLLEVRGNLLTLTLRLPSERIQEGAYIYPALDSLDNRIDTAIAAGEKTK